MAYIDPTTVVAPKAHLELREILCDTGEGGWSIAELAWDGEPTIGMRWNGSDDKAGSPYSRHPVWFILPPEFHGHARLVARGATTGVATD